MSLPSLHQLPVGVATREWHAGTDRVPRMVQRANEDIAFDECEICQEPMGAPSGWSVLCVNGHAFHRACIERYLLTQRGGTCLTGSCALTAAWAARRAALAAAGDVEMDDDEEEEGEEAEEGAEEEEEDKEEVLLCKDCGVEFDEDDGEQCVVCSYVVCNDCAMPCKNCDDVYCLSCAEDEHREGWCETCRQAN